MKRIVKFTFSSCNKLVYFTYRGTIKNLYDQETTCIILK